MKSRKFLWCVQIEGRDEHVFCRTFASAASLAKDLAKIGIPAVISRGRLQALGPKDKPPPKTK